MANLRYVLVTSARNEQDYIEKAIRAVLAQTILPEQWVIVNDSSIDRTEAIVNSYAKKYSFIQFVSVSGHRQRNFGSKANGINAGYEQLRNAQFDFLGNLDADISFAPNYYEKMMERFLHNPRLGIAGGIMLELIGGHFITQNISLTSVAGPIQLFRRKCFEDIGGYMPLNLGGVDAVAEITARMKGWEVQTFPEIKIFHHRRVGSGKGTVLSTRFRWVIRDYLLGYHPLFYAAVCAYRVSDRPYFLGSLLRMCGYCWSAIKRKKRPVAVDFIKYLRDEQMGRLSALFASARLIKASRIE